MRTINNYGHPILGNKFMQIILQSQQNRLSKAPQVAASFWAGALWFPVSLTYIAFVTTWICLLCSPDIKQRWQRACRTRMYFAGLFFMAWVVFSFLIHPGGALALTMLFHTTIFVLTLLAGLMLLPEEARVAWRSFIIMTCLMALMLFIHFAIWNLPKLPGINNLLVYEGNKSIRAGLLMGLASMACFSYLLWYSKDTKDSLNNKLRVFGRYFALAGFVAFSSIIIFHIPSRTAMLLLPMVLFVSYMHRKFTPLKSVFALLFILTASVSMYQVSSNIQHSVQNGVSTLVNDIELGHPTSSVGLRYYFYKFSLNEMLEHPVLGMGLGTWRDKWAEQESVFNWFANPHNDYLLYGSEAGIAALLALLAIYGLFFFQSLKIRTMWGSIASASALVAGLTALGNAGMRDAVFCFSLVWLMACAYSAASENCSREYESA